MLISVVNNLELIMEKNRYHDYVEKIHLGIYQSFKN